MVFVRNDGRQVRLLSPDPLGMPGPRRFIQVDVHDRAPVDSPILSDLEELTVFLLLCKEVFLNETQYKIIEI
jgi:hypothetical protein